jgi:hypothetical protein
VGIDIPWVLTDTIIYHGLLDGLLTKSSYGMGRQDVAILGEPDPRWRRPTSKLSVAEARMCQVMQLRTPEGLCPRR